MYRKQVDHSDTRALSCGTNESNTTIRRSRRISFEADPLAMFHDDYVQMRNSTDPSRTNNSETKSHGKKTKTP